MTMKVGGLRETYERFTGADPILLSRAALSLVKPDIETTRDDLLAAVRKLESGLYVDMFTVSIRPEKLDTRLARVYSWAVSVAMRESGHVLSRVISDFESVHEQKNQIFRDRFLGTGFVGIVTRIGDQAVRVEAGTMAPLAHIANYSMMGMSMLFGARLYYVQEMDKEV